ncbi:MAG: pantoate--beta-alanine ligase, partial [Bacteroidota bacterium]
MILFKKETDLTNWLDAQRKKGNKMGFVPTMGALHTGHISLIDLSKRSNEITVCSIFVNPAQFNDKKDFEKYPSTLEKDIYLLERAGCDIVFIPSVNEIYPDTAKFEKHYELGYLETILEGKYRPGHFQGVCKVMDRLLHIIKPNRLYLGQKDYQQCLVISKLVSLIGMKDQIEVIIAPTLREADGLAYSSRNLRLPEEGRRKAPVIYKSITMIKSELQKGNIEVLKKRAQAMLEEDGFKIDYIEIANTSNLV